MSRAEAFVTLGVAGVAVLFTLWLLVSHLRARRRIPERLVLPEYARSLPGLALPVTGDPREIVFEGEFSVFELSPLTGAQRTLPVWTGPGEPPFDWPPRPPGFDG